MSVSGSLGELCIIEKGTSPTLRTEPGQYPLVVTAEYRRSASTYQFDRPAVCIPLISSTGHGDAAIHRIHYEEGKFALANLLVALIPRDSSLCSARYLYLLLQSQKDRILVPLMRGTANVSLKEKDIAGVQVVLPPLHEQQKTVEWIDDVVMRVEQANSVANSVVKRLDNLLMSVFHEITEGVSRKPMNDVAPLVRRQAKIHPDMDYPELGVRCFGKGTFQKPSLSGLDVGTKKLYAIEPGDLVFSNVFAWEGAIAVAKDEDKGRFGSHRFITCVPIPGVATAVFLNFYFQTPEGIEQIRDASPGGAGRNRTLGLNKLEKIMVPVPRYELQLWFDQLAEKVETAKKTMIQTVEERNAFLPSVLNQVFSGEDSVA